MRILAIGLGGCGSRIVDHLYDHDIRSQINCVTPVTIDTDSNSMQQLRVIPKEARMNYRSIDPTIQYDTNTTLDFEEIMRVIQNQGTSEFDAIMLFAGLGGQLTDAMSVLIPELRAAYIEPVFTVCTLPYLHEGRAVASKAIDDLDLILDISDGVFLFDNDTWYRKIKVAMDHHAAEVEEKDPATGGQRKGWKDHIPHFPENPRDQFKLLNERIARQIGVLLRAGEFDEAGGMENAEIVLDAGEILNTITGNGITALGYAVERLPTSPGFSDILEKWRPKTYFTEDAHKKATRIVSLAKQAVYEDISVPCDITSADKALVLIAGPSNELSMKGFQTVRKWIDTSISGLEMRSGDYPVKSSKFVGIIIMLSGIKNIPRIEELRELKHEWEHECIEDEKRIEEARIQAEADLLLRLSSPDFVPEDQGLTEDDLIDDFEIFIEKIKNYNPVEESPGPIIVAEPVIDADTGKPDADGWIVPEQHYKTPYQPEEKDTEMKYPGYEKKSYETEEFSPNETDVAEPQQVPEPVTPVVSEPVEQIADSFIDLLEIEEEILEAIPEPIVSPPQPVDTTMFFGGAPETEDIDLFESDSPTIDDNVHHYQESQESAPPYREEEPFQQYPASEFEDFRDEVLTLSPRDDEDKPISGKKEENETEIVVPARNERNVASITRMTDIGKNSLPNDSSLGVRTSDRYQQRKNESQMAMVGEKISLSGASFDSRPNDASLSQGSIRKGSIPRANDRMFSGDSSVRVSSGKAANDSVISGGSIKLGTSPKPNESAINGVSIKLGTSPKTKDDSLGGSLAPGSTFPKPQDGLKTIGKNTAKKPDDSVLMRNTFEVATPTPKRQENRSSEKVRHTPQMPPAPRDDMLERAQERLKIQKTVVTTNRASKQSDIVVGAKAPEASISTPKPGKKPEQPQAQPKKETPEKKSGEKKTPDASDLFWIK